MYNSHVHSSFSRDCKASLSEMCDAAIKAGLKGISLTDHCDLDNYISDNVYTTLKKSVNSAKELSSLFNGNLKVFTGVELGGIIHRPTYASTLTKSFDFDIVLMSVHIPQSNGKSYHLSRVDFSAMPKEELISVIHGYFDEMYATVIKADFDVCAHLTLPFRYINGVYGRNIPVSLFTDDIQKVLSALIERGKALELNTSEINHQLFDFMPDESVLRLYRDMGGKLITIGSDAHKSENIALGFNEAFSLLKKCGFNEYHYYEKRVPTAVSL